MSVTSSHCAGACILYDNGTRILYFRVILKDVGTPSVTLQTAGQAEEVTSDNAHPLVRGFLTLLL